MISRDYAYHSTRSDERGASSVEYGFLAAAVAALVVVIALSLGGTVTGMFGSSCATIEGKAQTGATCATE